MAEQLFQIKIEGEKLQSVNALLEQFVTFGTILDQIEIDPIAQEATAFVLNRIRNRFLREVGPDEVAWIPSKAGIRRRAKGGTGTLFDTGRLFHSIQAAQLQDGQYMVSTDVPYAKHLGKWPFMGVGLQDVPILERLLARRLEQQLERIAHG